LLLMGSQSIVEKVKTLQRNILGHIIVWYVDIEMLGGIYSTIKLNVKPWIYLNDNNILRSNFSVRRTLHLLMSDFTSQKSAENGTQLNQVYKNMRSHTCIPNTYPYLSSTMCYYPHPPQLTLHFSAWSHRTISP
jgi:hypothetical protein